jgi:hypothetical protein
MFRNKSVRRIIDVAGRNRNVLLSLKPKDTVARLFSIPREYPFGCQLTIATFKTSAADIMVQTTVEKKSFSEIDVKRNAIFLLFGLAYLGGFQWWLLINKYKQWFPTMERFGNSSLSQKLRDPAGLRDAAKVRSICLFLFRKYTILAFIQIYLASTSLHRWSHLTLLFMLPYATFHATTQSKRA